MINLFCYPLVYLSTKLTYGLSISPIYYLSIRILNKNKQLKNLYKLTCKDKENPPIGEPLGEDTGVVDFFPISKKKPSVNKILLSEGLSQPEATD